MESTILERLVCEFHARGCTTVQIQRIFHSLGIESSMRTLQRILKRNGRNERQNGSSLSQVQYAIAMELEGAGCQLGYRSMWNRLKNKYNLIVTRDVVMMLLALMDPEGARLRKIRRLNRRVYLSKGPNYLWHMDGYDKLKPYGIAIHGCIDGFSRKILWLRAASTNNDPRVVASYYLNCIENLKGCPTLLRADRGTENGIVAIIHSMLRHHHSDGLSGSNSFIYGRSVNNQRIEALWSHLRKMYTDWWICFFKGLVMNRIIDLNSAIHLNIVRFCFGALIQCGLDSFVSEWNQHKIRNSRADAPSGKPDVLYTFPSLYDTQDHLKGIESYCSNYMIYLKTVRTHFECVDASFVHEEFALLARIICSVHGINLSDITFANAIKQLCLLLNVFQ